MSTKLNPFHYASTYSVARFYFVVKCELLTESQFLGHCVWGRPVRRVLNIKKERLGRV